MTSPGEPEPIELLDIANSETPPASDRITTRPLLLSSRWVQLGAALCFAALIAVLFGVGRGSSVNGNAVDGNAVNGNAVSESGPGSLAETSASASASASADPASVGPASTTADGDVGPGPPRGPADAAREFQHRLEELDGRMLLAMASPVGITLWDLAGGQTSLVPLPETPSGDGLVALGDRLVYVGETAAWSVSEAGDGRRVGPADEIRVAGDPDLVWLGTSLDEDAAVTYFDWSEVNVDGRETRRTRREMPLEFQTPDLVWGFNSSLFRLTDSDERPWRLMMYGSPLAVGPNDIIVKSCDLNECRRSWLDTSSGADRGPLLADVSTRFDGQRGWLSPDGRFVAFQEGSASEVQVLGLGLDAQRTLPCRSAREVVWSTAGLAVCVTDAGVAVVDLESGGSITVVPPADLFGVALWPRD